MEIHRLPVRRGCWIGTAEAAGVTAPALFISPSCSTSAPIIFLISRTEYQSYGVLLMRDRDTKRVNRLYDFSKARLIRPGVAYCLAGKVNSADKPYLVIESVRLDTKPRRAFIAPVPADSEGGPIVR